MIPRHVVVGVFLSGDLLCLAVSTCCIAKPLRFGVSSELLLCVPPFRCVVFESVLYLAFPSATFLCCTWQFDRLHSKTSYIISFPLGCLSSIFGSFNRLQSKTSYIYCRRHEPVGAVRESEASLYPSSATKKLTGKFLSEIMPLILE